MSTYPQPFTSFTHDEYLTFERAALDRHEYLDGLIYAMAGASEAHRRIARNLLISLGTHLRGGPCEVFGSDTKVRCGPGQGTSQHGLYAYPDLVVVCGAARYHDQHQDVLLNPTLLVEVLSPSTAAYDRGEKFTRYQRWLPTLMDYLLVEQTQPLLEHYARTEAGVWIPQRTQGLDASLHLERLGWTVGLAEVYERVVFAGKGETP